MWRLLITGGAGFVGSNLARLYQETDPKCQVTVLDNLRRRGSEVNLPDFKKRGISFFHGDIRNPSDLSDLPDQYDLFVEASAEPSVQAGTSGQPNYVLDTNLTGTQNCLEFARKRAGSLLFLSTSRVYSIEPLRSLAFDEGDQRLEISSLQKHPGVSSRGIREEFPTNLARSFYGTTKLASEMLIQEYVFNYGLKAVINRCGVLCGPGQFGKVDQGVFMLWVMNHFFKRPLRYTGFGGAGKQVRDLLHPRDLFELMRIQTDRIESISGEIYNIGGGVENSVSLREFTEICQKVTGNRIPLDSDPATSKVDVPYYISDFSKANQVFGWRPKINPLRIAEEILDWLQKDEDTVEQLLAA